MFGNRNEGLNVDLKWPLILEMKLIDDNVRLDVIEIICTRFPTRYIMFILPLYLFLFFLL